MIPYLIIYFILLLLPKFFKRKNRNKICFVILLIFMAIRFDVGFDFQGYYTFAKQFSLSKYGLFIIKQNLIYENEPRIWEYYRIEFFNKIIYKITWLLKMPQFMIISYSFLSLFFIKKGIENIGIKEEKEYIWLFFYTFPLFFLFFTNFMRQAVAVAIIFYAYQYLIKKKFIKFLIWVLIAMLFHKTAIFTLVVYVINLINIKNKSFYFICYILCFFGKSTITFFMKRIYIFKKYLIYINGYYQIGGEKIYYIIFLIGIILIIFKDRILKHKNTQLSLAFNLAFVGCSLYIALKGTGHLMYRASLYFLIFILYLIPEGIRIAKEIKLYKYFKFIYIGICFVMLVISLIIDSKAIIRPQYVPYDTFITNKEKIFYKIKKNGR